MRLVLSANAVLVKHFTLQGQKGFAIILAKNRDTAIFNRLYIKLYIKFVANNGKNRDSVHAAISFCPCTVVIPVLHHKEVLPRSVG